jgi:hypothetical protein
VRQWWNAAAFGVPHEGNAARYLKAAEAHGGGCVGTKLTHSHGIGAVWTVGLSDVHRPTGQWQEAVRAADVCGCDTWHRPRAWRASPLPCHSACDAASDRFHWPASASVYGAYGSEPTWPCATSRTRGSGRVPVQTYFKVALLTTMFPTIS